MTRTTIIFSAIVTLLVLAFSQCGTIPSPKSEDAYQVAAFFNGSEVKALSIHTSDGQLISSLEVPKGVFLSIYADKSNRMGPKPKNPFAVARPSGDTPIEYSGRVSIRTQLAQNVKDSWPASDSFIEVPLRLDLINTIVKVRN